ncbi:acyltransferase family protein [Paraburkholderia kururiensis]|uniref:acyltransferase family protein n=1 Tax=Paraburkholderia kururiensis TaxID=984307 RepID=UPI0018F54CC0|nr:acyltransferase [Paraburkholderia kururiensis]
MDGHSAVRSAGAHGEGSARAAASGKSLKIDAIRFLAATWVMLYHFGPPPFKEIFKAVLPPAFAPAFAPVGGALWSGSVVLFAGPAAVIVFFVISGYCIHHAWHRDAVLKPVNYFASRYVRIGLPLAVAVLVCQPLPGAGNLLQSVLWSLYCEIVYYTLYPLLRSYFRYAGEMIVGIALAGAAMVWYVHTHTHIVCEHCVYETYGVAGTSFLYLPGWLLGCLVAEIQQMGAAGERGGASLGSSMRSPMSAFTARFAATLRAVAQALSTQLVATRIAVVAAASLTFVLASTSRIKPAFLPFIGPDITLPIFQLVATAWIAAELARPSRSRFWNRVGALGAWSYSLYLCHKLAQAILGVTGSPPGAVAAWFATVVIALAVSYAFYHAVERPSHRLAHRLRKFAQRVPTRPAV